jgi:hypothetical protein
LAGSECSKCRHYISNIYVDNPAVFSYSADTMKLDAIRSGKNNTHVTYLLRESYREGGKVKNRTVANVSHLPPEEIEALRLALKLKGELPRLLAGAAAGTDALGVRQGLSYGAVRVVQAVLARQGIAAALGDDEAGRLAQWQVLARVVAQGSRLSAVRLARAHAAGELVGSAAVDERRLYQNLDWLCQRQGRIEAALFAQAHPSGRCGLFLYDVTSSYLEGRHNELAAFGYNRDKKKGKRQIVVGLLADETGRGLSVEVFAGNTADPATFGAQVRKAAERFGGGEVTFVGDRGMIRSRQVQAVLDHGCHYITAITKPEIEALLVQGVIQLGLFDQALAEVTAGGVRYILRRNPVRAAEMGTKRAARRVALERAVARENTYLAEHPRAARDKAEQRLAARLGRLRLPGLRVIPTGERALAVAVDEAVYARAGRLDGCYVLKTDLPAARLDRETVHARYRDLAMVERGFRGLKTAHLELRPVYLRLADRTRAHALVCLLALRVRQDLEKCWAGLDVTVEEGLRELASLCLEEVVVKGEVVGCRVPEPRESVKRLLAAAGVTLPAVPSRPPAARVATTRRLPSRRKSK